jgi:hypothetical protein
MNKLKTIALGDTIVALLLDEFKQFAAVPDDSTDKMLESVLRTALLRVQEYADTALVQTVLELTTEPDGDGLVRLYEGGGRIIRLTTADGGSVAYTAQGSDVVKVRATGTVVVRWQTMPSDGDLNELKPTVFRYGLAIYDGETTEVLNGILNEALC